MILKRCLAPLFLLLVDCSLFGQEISAGAIIGKFHNIFTSPPSHTPGRVAVDGPLLGNGFAAAVLAGPPERQNYYLARNDLWRLKSGFNESFPAVLGRLQVHIPVLKGANYRVEQDLYDAITTADLYKGDTVVRIRSWMAATRDWLVIEIVNSSRMFVSGDVSLQLPDSNQFYINPPLENRFPDSTASGRGVVQWIQRGFIKDVDIPDMAAAACTILGGTSGVFSIQPKRSITILCALSSSFKSSDGLRLVRREVEGTSARELSEVSRQHLAWWHHYWNESYLHIDDSVIEHQYYRSQYNLASCSRDPRFPPGIFGSWVTQEIPAWNGDYHLNYNYIAPFYALYSSNHMAVALPFEAPVLDFMERGRYYSSKITHIPGGVLYPVGIGPLGIETTRKNGLMIEHTGYVKSGEAEDEGLFFGQKSDAAYCVVNFSLKFYRTWDASFARRAYPFIKAVAVFWQHYLKFDNGRYIIENDAIHEGTIGTKNPILSLGLVRMVLQTAMDMGALLKIDTALRADWKEKLDHLSAYPTQVRHGKTVFRYTEKGVDWWGDNTLGIQHIYPAGQIGLNSDSDLLQTARNTIEEMHRWGDFNGTNSFYPAAVRVGYNPDTILAKLHHYSMNIYPNGFQYNNPHGIENCSTVPNTINEMLCMSNQGILRVFGVWPRERDASFYNIRCEGAFLVSSTFKNRRVQYIDIFSEKGRTCILQNPWPDQVVEVRTNMGRRFKVNGHRISFHTSAGERLHIVSLDR